jgi:hypothetical protein
MTAERRGEKVDDGGAHSPKTKWRPALPPASTVPGSVISPEGEMPFPGRFRPRPCGPGRSLRFPHRNIATPDRAPAGPAPCLAAGHGSLAGSELSAVRLQDRFPIGLRRSEASSVSFRNIFNPGVSDIAGPLKESGFGFGFRRRLALLPSGCPDLASIGFRPRTSAALRGAVAESVIPFPEGRALPQEGHWHPNPIRPNAKSGSEPVDNGDNGD